ncbi:hypothetical protein CGRA01v4_10839 [Colletotrichum graminicola]|nr:hypothetical protein CGRA01v4_10839 [Colletotrichum graminicola]
MRSIILDQSSSPAFCAVILWCGLYVNSKVLYPDEPFRRPSFRHLPHPSPPDRQSLRQGP